jgi:hypothetical protein
VGAEVVAGAHIAGVDVDVAGVGTSAMRVDASSTRVGVGVKAVQRVAAGDSATVDREGTDD